MNDELSVLAARLDSLQLAFDATRALEDAHRERADAAEAAVLKLREALEHIHYWRGHVCGAYDICSPEDCIAPECGPWAANEDSYAAWSIADEALADTGEA
jgi:hypothetical protein